MILRLNELNGLPATIYRLGKYSYIITIYDPTYRMIGARPVSVLVAFPAIYYRPPTSSIFRKVKMPMVSIWFSDQRGSLADVPLRACASAQALRGTSSSFLASQYADAG